MTVEVVTFGMFLLGHAWGWRSEGEVFRDAQALLHPGSGARGTAVLLVGSWFAYQAVLENHTATEDPARRARATAGWLLGAAVAGVLFTVNKCVEYASPDLANVTLSTNAFWFSYLFLTGLHLLHVVGGVLALGWIAREASRGAYGPERALTVEAVAAYWHLVDLIWILLFPILYVMHP